MKNLIIFAVLICCGIQITQAQVRVTDFTESELKGHVKQVIEYTYRGDQSVDTSGTAEKSIKNFDEKGNQLDESIYDRSGDLQSKFLFEYPNDTIIIKKQYDPSGKLFCNYFFIYDHKGKEVEFDTHSDYNPRLKIDAEIIYKYDSMGNRVEETTYINRVDVTQKVISVYNKNHQESEEQRIAYYFKKEKRENIVFKYDNMGRKIKSETFDSNGKLTGENIITYNNIDEQGNWLLKTFETKGHSQMQGDYLFKNITKRVIKYF